MIDYFVLDALADDLESIDNIMRSLNHKTIGWLESNGGSTFERAEVTVALTRCVRDRLVNVYPLAESGKELARLPEGTLPSEGLEDCWFGLTGAGRLVHGNWDPEPPGSQSHPHAI